VPFTTASAVSVDSILAAIQGSGDVTLGIMTDATGLPSNTYLYSTVLANPVANVSLTGLGWALGAGNYWLAAVGVDGFNGSWPGGDNVTLGWAFTPSGSVITDWFSAAVGFEVPAARITANAAVPEPVTLLLITTGLLGFAPPAHIAEPKMGKRLYRLPMWNR